MKKSLVFGLLFFCLSLIPSLACFSAEKSDTGTLSYDYSTGSYYVPLNGSWYENTLKEKSRFRHYFYRFYDNEFSVVDKKAGTETFFNYSITDGYITISRQSIASPKIKEGTFPIHIMDADNFTIDFSPSMKFIRNSYSEQQAREKAETSAKVAAAGFAVAAVAHFGGKLINYLASMGYPTAKAYKKMNLNQQFDAYAGESSGKVLSSNMSKALGVPQPKGSNAHHIVPKKSTVGNAEISRQVLNEVGIDLNNPVNGVFLPSDPTIADLSKMAYHKGCEYMHRYEFQSGLSERLLRARGNKSKVIEVLNDARNLLLKGETW